MVAHNWWPAADGWRQAGGITQWRHQLVLASAFVIAALAVRWLVDPWIGDRHEFLPAYAAVLAVSWLGTWRAGLVVALLFCVAHEWYFPEPKSVADAELLHAVVAEVTYWLVAGALAFTGDQIARAQLRLRARVDDLRDSDTRKSEFMALVAHELRNPLGALSMGTHLIRQGKLEEGALDGAWRRVERGTEQMQRIIGDLMDVARVEQGKLELVRQPVHIASLVQESVADASTFTVPRAQQVVVSMPEAAGYVQADPLRLRQVFDNLLHNASKFSPDGGVIEVLIAAVPAEVRISVTDCGIGIPASELRSVFEPFVQIKPAVARSPGLGLGLALCRKLVELHGGSIEAHSEGRGKGSEFRVRLPRPPELSAPQRRDGSPAAPATASAAAAATQPEVR